jgi:excisionase family DNA binding protein
MLSVKEAAQRLKVSEQRVRTMIYDGVLPAEREGMKWFLFEEAIMERVQSRPRPGRPRKSGKQGKARSSHYLNSSVKQTTQARPESLKTPETPEAPETQAKSKAQTDLARVRDLYWQCKKEINRSYNFDLLSAARTSEERGFYVLVADYFLQCKQAELIKRGVF